jgi:alkylhydroperoxidase family enzyme
VQAVLADPATAPIGDKLRAVLPFLRKVTREHGTLGPDDVRALDAAGVTRAQLEDALMVTWCFNVITRLADTFEFHVGPQASFDSSAKMLLTRGYKL